MATDAPVLARSIARCWTAFGLDSAAALRTYNVGSDLFLYSCSRDVHVLIGFLSDIGRQQPALVVSHAASDGELTATYGSDVDMVSSGTSIDRRLTCLDTAAVCAGDQLMIVCKQSRTMTADDGYFPGSRVQRSDDVTLHAASLARRVCLRARQPRRRRPNWLISRRRSWSMNPCVALARSDNSWSRGYSEL